MPNFTVLFDTSVLIEDVPDIDEAIEQAKDLLAQDGLYNSNARVKVLDAGGKLIHEDEVRG